MPTEEIAISLSVVAVIILISLVMIWTAILMGESAEQDLELKTFDSLDSEDVGGV